MPFESLEKTPSSSSEDAAERGSVPRRGSCAETDSYRFPPNRSKQVQPRVLGGDSLRRRDGRALCVAQVGGPPSHRLESSSETPDSRGIRRDCMEFTIVATITKKELVNRISDMTKQTKLVTKDVIQMFLDEIVRELGRGNRLEFREFGVFEIKQRAARKAQNPRTLQKVEVPSKQVVKFKVGRSMKEAVDRLEAAGGIPIDEPLSIIHDDDD